MIGMERKKGLGSFLIRVSRLLPIILKPILIFSKPTRSIIKATLEKAEYRLRGGPSEEYFINGLRHLGVRFQLLESLGLPEERVGDAISGQIIEIADGPIRWINLAEVEQWEPPPTSTTYAFYGVPDSRISSGLSYKRKSGVGISTVRVRAFPLTGRIVDLSWKGKDGGLGIIRRLSRDDSLKVPIIESRDIAIGADPEIRCWFLKTQGWHAPSLVLWRRYQSIAGHLLETPIPSSGKST